jgi:hypothetical protein
VRKPGRVVLRFDVGPLAAAKTLLGRSPGCAPMPRPHPLP